MGREPEVRKGEVIEGLCRRSDRALERELEWRVSIHRDESGRHNHARDQADAEADRD
jgi:hypothetical protein